MTSSRRREEHVFVVRLWREAKAPEDAWRGWVTHVDSGQRLATTELRAIGDFIGHRLAGSSTLSSR